MTVSAANALWLAGCLPAAARFRRATTRVREAQERILRRLLAANADTEFGRRYDFASVRSVGDYQDRVPLWTYDDYRPWVDRVANGVPGVLTTERVRLLEPTSGSAGATKLIPYTRSLQREFQHGIRAWIADLFLHDPDLMRGQAYWSVSPPSLPRRSASEGGTEQYTSGGIPIGFDDDSCYVGSWQRRLVQSVMAVPADISRGQDIEAWRYHTLRSLVRCSSLRLISVWNPTFLSLLIDRLPMWSDAIARDLHAGVGRVPRPSTTLRAPRASVEGRSGPGTDRRRANVLRAAMRAATAGERHAILWPRLSLISCWTDANAAGAAAALAPLFPHAKIQGKGLIATEGFISFPLVGREAAALAVRSHFLEFALLEGQDLSRGRPCLAHELERGRRYAVILSTGGGLYRYQLHDVVEVAGHVGECPLIRFVGRDGYVVDWFGEKLNEAFVGEILRETFDSLGVAPAFAMAACDTSLPSPAYVLYVETSEPNELLGCIAARVEAGLRRGFHYDYARLLGQLGPLRVFRVEGAASTYLQAALCAGQRAGDVKPLALDRRDGWSQKFREAFVPASHDRELTSPTRIRT